MSFLPLFILNTLIWGTTWIAIKYQVDVVSPVWSVVYRFSIASALLACFCLITRRSLAYNRQAHLIMATQGLCLFCLNYILYYIGTKYLITGLVALISAMNIFFNIFNSKLFFKMPIIRRVFIGASIGMLGLAVVFSGELLQICRVNTDLKFILFGVLCSCLAAYIASLGNMTALKLHRMQIPLLQSATISMAYGAVFSLIIAILSRAPLQFSLNYSYLISLTYLIIFGTIIAFGCYLSLLASVGPARAAYISIITPVVAILLSTLVEGFVWTYNTFIGMLLIVCGNILVLTKRNPSVKAVFEGK